MSFNLPDNHEFNGAVLKNDFDRIEPTLRSAFGDVSRFGVVAEDNTSCLIELPRAPLLDRVVAAPTKTFTIRTVGHLLGCVFHMAGVAVTHFGPSRNGEAMILRVSTIGPTEVFSDMSKRLTNSLAQIAHSPKI
jgi:hypothetical protein